MGNWGEITLVLGVITPVIAGRGPPCTKNVIILVVTIASWVVGDFTRKTCIFKASSFF